MYRNLKNRGGPDEEKAEHTSAYTCTTPVGATISWLLLGDLGRCGLKSCS